MADQQQQQQQRFVPSDDDLAQLQKLSAEYEPETTGPLVSERQSTSNIANEYATADPIYRTKTAALTQKFHQYRTCRGDGHCGWRAIAFSYFESLQRLGEVNKIQEEVARLTSLRNLLAAVGFDAHTVEDFEEETLDLLKRLPALAPTDDNAILTAFNDYSTAMAIITHIKLLTSAYLRNHPEDYQDYLPNQTVVEYCQSSVDPSNCELEHISMDALFQVLLKPAGISLEVLYLDRSPGTQVNEHIYAATDIDGVTPLADAPTITLIYRPGHYDIIYKIEAPQPVSLPSNVYTVGIAEPTDEYLPPSRLGPDVFGLIPGLSLSGSHMYSSSQWQPPPASYPDFAGPSPISPLPPSHLPAVPAYNAPPPTPITPSVPQPRDYGTLPVPAVPLEPPLAVPSMNRPIMTSQASPFRPSVFNYELMGASQPQLAPCQTAIFRNSHFNPAHFLNPDFQPEEWSPDSESSTGNHRSRNRP